MNDHAKPSRARFADVLRPLPPTHEIRELRRERRVMLRRALRGRCPLCATKGIRDGWAGIQRRCPGCNLAFSRERGYLVGAAWFNLSVTLLLLGVILVGGAAVTAPDIPWPLLASASVAVVLVGPILFQPFAVALFLWVDLAYFRPLDAGDLAANDPDAGPGP